MCKDDFPADNVVDVVGSGPQASSVIDPDCPVRSDDQEYQGSSVDEAGKAQIHIQEIEHSETDQKPQSERYNLRNHKIYHT